MASDGSVVAVIDSSYNFDFKIEVCSRNAAAGDANDCIKSSLINVLVSNGCILEKRTTLPIVSESSNAADYKLNGTFVQL